MVDYNHGGYYNHGCQRSKMLKFYNREKELEVLNKAENLKENHSIMSIIVGRRRIGKTSLALKVSSNKKLYFFISKKSEKLLCDEFIEEMNRQNIKVFGEFNKFEDLFAYLVEFSKTTPLTLIIDEFQEFLKINPSIFSAIQKVWDMNKNTSHLHLIICGSVYSMMKKIFEDIKEPLFGRADFRIELKPFDIETLKEILVDYNNFSFLNLLDFYVLTGGVAKYIDLFALTKSFSLEKMIEEIISPYSIFLNEGRNRLIEEFGKDYGVYFSILSLIASSKTSKSEIESVLQKSVSGYLFRLENDYNVIRHIKPINAKKNSKTQKYEIVDNFLRFWFRFIYKNQSFVESESFNGLKTIIHRDFSTYKGRLLEYLFIELLKKKEYSKIGSYWERGNNNEIDIVAIDELNKKILIAEVKLNPKRLNLNELIKKSQKLINDYKSYEIDYKLLSLDDINEFL